MIGVESDPRGQEDRGAERELRQRPCCARSPLPLGGWCYLPDGHDGAHLARETSDPSFQRGKR